MGRENRQVALLEAGIYSSDDRVGLVLVVFDSSPFFLVVPAKHWPSLI